MQVAREAFMKVMNTIVLSVTKRQVEVDGPTEVDGAVQPLIFQATMEVFLYNSTVCRLCGEENDSGTLLYSEEENCQNLSEIINTYLPIKVFDDGQLPRTICPGCTIQLEASVEFLNLIINGQKVIRELHQREKEYKRTVLKNGEQDGVTESIIFEINTDDGVFQMEHPIALQVAGLDRPKRKRGRPPKKLKSAEELALEADLLRSREIEPPQKEGEQDEVSGKRRRKTPTRYKEAVQGKELDRIFKEEGVTEGEDSDEDVKPDVDEAPPPPPREPQVIGHLETSGELVVVVKGKGRGRPKGRMRPTHEQCAICGMEFSCVGRYMSHVAQHGPVQYQCAQCAATFATRLLFNEHQQQSAHAGQHVIAGGAAERPALATDVTKSEEGNKVDVQRDPLLLDTDVEMRSMPDLNPKAEDEFVDSLVNGKAAGPLDVCSSPGADRADKENTQPVTTEIPAAGPKEKVKVKCPHCDKLFSSRQSKSMHIKAVHKGERPYVCLECGAVFPYPRSLALHTLSHRRQRAGSASARRYACDLCGKVLNHPSSVVYHKEAEHAGQRYVCNTCGKCFKHKQLLQRHQLVHSQVRPYSCKVTLYHCRCSSVVYHKEAEHAGQRYVCNTCGKCFKHKQLLQRHQLVHSQVRPYSCKTCNASFKTKANLINHQLLHSGVKKFTCEICKHKFAHKTSLTLHMRWHTGSKPYACKICDKSFSQKGNLSEHERIHTGEKPYQCSLCPRRFTTSSQYRLHARRHQPERSYACTHCPKRFASRGGWAAHARRALGAAGAPHKCAHCSRAFSERWALRKHVRSHTGERPFRCAHCPRAFADCSNLNKHTKHVHKQMSLLVKKDTEQQLASMSPRPEPQAAAGADASPAREESVIYVTYDVNDADSAFHILDPEQAASLDNRKMLTTCELYPGPSLLMPQLEHEQLVLEDEQLELQDEQLELQDEQLELQDAQLELQDEQLELQDEQLELQVEQLELQDEKLELQDEQLELEDEHLVSLDESEPIVVDTSEHMAVTDEQGNPLHFTMQDGTRLAITSVDGKSLQVVTQDGQTIPVEINGYSGDEDADEPAEAPAPRPAEPPKGVRARAASPVTHYFTIV